MWPWVPRGPISRVTVLAGCQQQSSASAVHYSTHYVFSVCYVVTSCCLVTASRADVSLTLGSRTIPVPQLPASNSNGSQGPNRSSPPLLHAGRYVALISTAFMPKIYIHLLFSHLIFLRSTPISHFHSLSS
jgi:hypothetical protein